MQSITETTKLPELAEQITREHSLACDAARSALAHARSAGALLLEAKEQIEHGGWLSWLKSNFQFSERTAQGYMRLSREWATLESKAQRVADLSIREALALLAPPKELEVHELGEIFPHMQPHEFKRLKESIKKSGLYHKITLYEGKILDGKERYRACREVGVEPQFDTFEDRVAAGFRGTPIDFLLSKNLYRQHFTEDQLAMAAVRLTDLKESANVC